MRTKQMEDFGISWKENTDRIESEYKHNLETTNYVYKKSKKAIEESWLDKTFGKACKICGKRPYTFSASKGAEGGRDSTCQCKK